MQSTTLRDHLPGRTESAATVRFGELDLALIPTAEVRVQPDAEVRPFLVGDGRPDPIRLSVELGTPQVVAPAAPGFQSGPWSVRQVWSGYNVTLSSAPGQVYGSMEVDAGFRAARLVLRRETYAGREVWPAAYPVDEWLINNALHQGYGLEAHGCGVRTAEGRGLLFLGQSGEGKSTLARLWRDQGATVLSDDRILLRPRPGRGWDIWGTPWHGEAGLADPGGAPLQGIFLLRQAAQAHQLSFLDPAVGAAAVLARLVVPFWRREAVDWALTAVERLLREVPLGRFSFVKHPSAPEYLLQRL